MRLDMIIHCILADCFISIQECHQVNTRKNIKSKVQSVLQLLQANKVIEQMMTLFLCIGNCSFILGHRIILKDGAVYTNCVRGTRFLYIQSY